MRVLLVGTDQQFTREINRYGAEYIEAGEDDAQSLPADVSATILASRNVSLDVYTKTRAHCAKYNIPIFVSRNGFSDVKPEFESFFKQGGPDMDQTRVNAREQIHAIIKQAYENGLTGRETIAKLRREGFKNTLTGKRWTPNIVHAIRWSNKKKADQLENATTAKPQAAKVSSSDLINKILMSSLPSDRKIYLIEQAQLGLITGVTGVSVEKTEAGALKLTKYNLLNDLGDYTLFLDKTSALLVIEAIDQIRKYVAE